MMVPLLFILFMNKIMKEASRADPNSTTFAYADDVVVTSESIQDLQDAQNRWNSKLEENGMELI